MVHLLHRLYGVDAPEYCTAHGSSLGRGHRHQLNGVPLAK